MNSKRDEQHRVMKSLKFGVEIETVRLPQMQIATAVAGALGGRIDPYNQRKVIDQQGRTWSVVNDGSLSGAHNGELVTPILTYDDMDRLQSVVRALRAAGARTDRSCGLHYAARVAMHRNAPDGPDGSDGRSARGAFL